MDLSELRAEVYAIVKASNLATTEVTAKLNEALMLTVAEVKPPDLKRFDVVTTIAGQAYTSLTGLSGGFSGMLLKIGTSDSKPRVQQYPDIERLVDRYGTLSEVGDVEAAALEGNILWYAKIPAIPVMLPIVYLRLPDKMVDEEDVPTIIPEYLHRNCLVYRAAELLWDSLEDGMEGEKVNTMGYRNLAEAGITKFREHLARSKKHFISSMWRY